MGRERGEWEWEKKTYVVNECMSCGSVADIQVNYLKEMQHASTDVLFEPLNDGNALNLT